MMKRKRLTLAVFKFASCDGCQLSLLDAEDDLLQVAEAIDIAFFPEASSRMLKGPYDVGLVEGSITVPHDVERIRNIRRACGTLISIGACATAGGIQALRNWTDVSEYARVVYAKPEYVLTLDRSMPIGSYVHVDYELRGCPISKSQLVDTIGALLRGQTPSFPTYSVCVDCKIRGVSCVMVGRQTPCLGPVTQAGCGAICPSYNRGCYGCFGPMDSPNTAALSANFRELGYTREDIMMAFRGFAAYAEAFRKESETHEK